MAILWMGGEDIDFPTVGALASSTSTAYRRTTYARSAVYSASSGANPARSNTFPGGAVTNAWLSCRMYWGVDTGTRCIGLGKSGNLTGLYIGSASSSGTKWALWKGDGSTWTELATESGTTMTASASGATYKIDMQIASFGASGTVTLYVDGVQKLTYTGNLTVTGMATNLDVVTMAGGAGGGKFSEIIVADEDTRTFSLVTLAPNAAGNVSEWNGTYADVDEATIDDADVIYSDVGAARQRLALSDMPAGTFTVKAAAVKARASRSSGAMVSQIGVGWSNGTTDQRTALTPTTAWATFERYDANNPFTSATWTTAEINAIQAMFEAVS